jgi:amidase
VSTDLSALDATAQAALVASGDVTPAELVEAAARRIEALQPRLNALTTDRVERAVDEARAASFPDGPLPDGPFRGVPFLVKDLACPMAGEPAHEGTRVLKDHGHVADADSHLARRYREAGLVVLGRTNTPEFGIMPTTEPASYGPTRNPWDLERTPGGSSGGSAAAVAAGLVPVAHASDGGGSIRIPAACCGLVGLKTSRGRVSVGPAGGELRYPLGVQFAVTRSVRDAAALLDVAAGPEPGDPVTPPPPPRPYRELAEVEPPRLRIGVMTTMPGTGDPVHADCVAGAEAAAELLEAMGHHLEVAHPGAFDETDRITAFAVLWSSQTAVNVRLVEEIVGRRLGAADFEPLTWELAVRGREVSAVDHALAVHAMQQWCRRFMQWWADGWDLLLTPTLGEPPVGFGVLSTPDEPIHGFARAGTFTPYTPAMNQTGQPAISLPLHHDDAGLPIGVQLAAAPGREDLLLQVARQLETAAPWADRRPPVHASVG